MGRKEKADEYHRVGYNCCQAVICSFADILDLDQETALRIGEGFGLGMGGMDGDCGALSGAIMTAGLRNSDRNLDAPKSKKDTYRLANEMVQTFRKQSGALICRELKGVDTGKVLCPCPQCIQNAVGIVEEVLGIPD